jgi:hypothetical protein
VCRLQRGIEPVESVTRAVVVEGEDLRAVMPPDATVAGRALVDVITEVHDQVGILPDHVIVGRVVTRLVVLAGSEREPQPVGQGVRGGQGTGATLGAGFTGGLKLVPVPTVGAQALDLHVNGVRPLGVGDGLAGADDAPEAFVFRDHPRNLDGRGRHAAAGFERSRCQSGPEHDTVRRGIAGGHAEGKRIRGEAGRGRDRAGEPGRGEQGGGGERGGAGDECTSGNLLRAGKREEGRKHAASKRSTPRAVKLARAASRRRDARSWVSFAVGGASRPDPSRDKPAPTDPAGRARHRILTVASTLSCASPKLQSVCSVRCSVPPLWSVRRITMW